jgi:hypothetical protein
MRVSSLMSVVAHVLASAFPLFKSYNWRESYPIPRIRSRGTCRRPTVSRKIRRG